jgi:hypothetical protein
VRALLYRQAWNVRRPKFRVLVQYEIDTRYRNGEVRVVDRVQMLSNKVYLCVASVDEVIQRSVKVDNNRALMDFFYVGSDLAKSEFRN